MTNKLPKVGIIIPAYNECESVLAETLKGVVKSLKDIHCFNFMIIVVDDGSDKPISSTVIPKGGLLVRHLANLGQGAALRTGLEIALSYSDLDYFLTFDADGQHSKDSIVELFYVAVDSGCDVIFSTRFNEAMSSKKDTTPAFRKIILRLATKFENLITGISLSDAHNGFRLLTRKAASLIKIQQPGMAHATEIRLETSKNNLSHVEIYAPVVYTPYSMGKGQSSLAAIKILIDLLEFYIFDR